LIVLDGDVATPDSEGSTPGQLGVMDHLASLAIHAEVSYVLGWPVSNLGFNWKMTEPECFGLIFLN